MAASDYVPIFFKNRLHLAGRPQMSSRPKCRYETGLAHCSHGHFKASEAALVRSMLGRELLRCV
jgi:hypothetical protein